MINRRISSNRWWIGRKGTHAHTKKNFVNICIYVVYTDISQSGCNEWALFFHFMCVVVKDTWVILYTVPTKLHKYYTHNINQNREKGKIAMPSITLSESFHKQMSGVWWISLCMSISSRKKEQQNSAVFDWFERAAQKKRRNLWHSFLIKKFASFMFTRCFALISNSSVCGIWRTQQN